MDKSNTEWWKMAAVWGAAGLIIGLLIGMAIGWRWQISVGEATGQQMSEENQSEENNTAKTVYGDASVNIGTQTSGQAVLVESVSLPTTSWIAVHEIIEGEETGNVLGAARRDAGEYQNVVVNLLRGTDPDREYAIVLYADNGNGEFDLKADLPIVDSEGQPVIARFMTEFPSNPAGL